MIQLEDKKVAADWMQKAIKKKVSNIADVSQNSAKRILNN